MPRSALSEVEVEDFRNRIIEAATGLFAARGYDAVTMRAIAAGVGKSPMTPYRYFANKDEIFAAVRAEAYRRFADTQRGAFERSNHPVKRLLQLHEAYLDFALAESNAYRVMFQLDQPAADPSSAVGEQSGRAFSYLRDAVQKAVEADYLAGDPLTVAHLLWAQVHGLIALHLAGKLNLGRTLDALRAAPAPLFKSPASKE